MFDKLLPSTKPEKKSKVIVSDVDIETVVNAVAEFYKVTFEEVVNVKKRPQKENEARKIAIYLSQELTACYLKEIVTYFNLGNVGSVSHATFQIRNRKRSNKKFKRKVEEIIKLIVRNAT